jgi:hypothetical protein
MDLGEVRRSRGYQQLIKVGLVSYGVVHLLVAWIALQLAFGRRGDASPNGALKEVARQPLGEGLLWVMAVGLFALTTWQLIEATVGHDDPNRQGKVKGRVRSAGRAAVYLALGVLSIGVALGSSSAQSGQGEETLTAKLMALPFGQILVAVVGAAVLGVGIGQVVKGVRKKFVEDLDRNVTQWVLRLGSVGYICKGIALAIVGVLFGWAAITYDPKKAGGMDAALATIKDQPAGTVLLVAMAVGIACFGVYCFAWARSAATRSQVDYPTATLALSATER